MWSTYCQLKKKLEKIMRLLKDKILKINKSIDNFPKKGGL